MHNFTMQLLYSTHSRAHELHFCSPCICLLHRSGAALAVHVCADILSLVLIFGRGRPGDEAAHKYSACSRSSDQGSSRTWRLKGKANGDTTWSFSARQAILGNLLLKRSTVYRTKGGGLWNGQLQEETRRKWRRVWKVHACSNART